MDCYQIWADLAPGVRDLELVTALGDYLGALQHERKIDSFRIMRRKLGFGPEGLGEWSISIYVQNLTQLDQAFLTAAARVDPVESLHRNVWEKVVNFRSALYRDFPDAVREG